MPQDTPTQLADPYRSVWNRFQMPQPYRALVMAAYRIAPKSAERLHYRVQWHLISRGWIVSSI